MSERTEWPTEDHLGELRRRGVVPISSFAAASAAAFFFAGALYSMRSKIADLAGRAREAAGLQDILSILGGHDFAMVFVVPAVFAILGAFAAGFLQSRFLIRSGAFGFDLGRLSPFRRSGGLWLRERLALSAAAAVVGLCLALVAGAFAAYALGPLIAVDAAGLGFAAQALLKRAVVAACAVFGAGALIAWLTGRFFFMLRHRMTREEKASEGHEDSVSRVG